MEINIIGPNDPALEVARAMIEAHPEWGASITIHPWSEYHTVLMASLNAQISPNQAVFLPGHVWIPELADKGFISNLDLLMTRVPHETYLAYQPEDILDRVAEEGRYRNEQYMIPTFTDGHILFYRSDLFALDQNQAVPTVSPLDLEEMAARVHKPTEVFGMALKSHPSEIFFDWLPFLLESGGEVLDLTLQPAFSSEAGIRSLKSYCRLRKFCPAETHTFGNLEIANVLREGKTALVTTWGGQAAPIFLDEKNPYRDLYKAAVYPHPCGGTWGVALPANQPDDSKLRALQIAMMINGPAQDLEVILKAGSPVRKTSYSQEAFEKYFWLKAQFEMMKRITWLPRHPVVGMILGPITEAVYRAFTGEIEVEKALQDAAHTIKMLRAG